MEKESIITLMVPHMKVTIRMESNVAKEYTSGQMERAMKENGRMTCVKEKECKISLMG